MSMMIMIIMMIMIMIVMIIMMMIVMMIMMIIKALINAHDDNDDDANKWHQGNYVGMTKVDLNIMNNDQYNDIQYNDNDTDYIDIENDTRATTWEWPKSIWTLWTMINTMIYNTMIMILIILTLKTTPGQLRGNDRSRDGRCRPQGAGC